MQRQQISRAERIAATAGLVVGMVGRVLPGIAGAVLVSAGLWMAWPPLGVVAAGGFLLALDRKIPGRRQP